MTTNNVKTDNVLFKYLKKKATTADKIQGVLKVFGVSNDDISDDGNLADALEMQLKERMPTPEEIASVSTVLSISAARLIDEHAKEMLRRVGKKTATKSTKAAAPAADTRTHSHTPAFRAERAEGCSSTTVERVL